jgi:tRNA (Thr-GGU) A37 N-methylase
MAAADYGGSNSRKSTVNGSLELKVIGRVHEDEQGFSIRLSDEYIEGLQGLKGYSHLQAILWADRCATPQGRQTLNVGKLFRKGPSHVGIFATRAPARPNPLLISTLKVGEIDYAMGRIRTPFIDALDNTPVLDLKPYNPMERVRDCSAPQWCSHWPEWYEDAAAFNWEDEIVFPQNEGQ